MNNTSLSRSVIWYSLGNIFIRSVSFFFLPLYSNLIRAADFGNYSLLMSVYAILLVVYQLGMFNAMNKFFIEESSAARRKLIFSSILNSILITGVFLTLLFSILSSRLSHIIFNKYDFSSLLTFVFISIFFETINAYILYLLKTMEMAKKAVSYTALGAILNLVLNIILVYYLRLSIAGIIYSQLISVFILCLILSYLIKDNYVFRIDKDILKVVIKFSIPILFASLFTAGSNVADRFILNIFAGREEVGLYSFAYRIAIVMNIFVASFYAAWNPHSLNLYYKKDYESSFGVTLNKLVASCCLILLTVSLLTRYLFDINIYGISLFNPGYKAGIIIIPIVMTGYIFNGISLFYTVYPTVANKTHHILLANLTAFALNIGLNFLLIPRFGMVGAAISTLTGFLFSSFYLFFVSRKAIIIEYQYRELIIIIITVVLFLIIGLSSKNIFIDLLLILLYLFTLQFFAKIRINQISAVTNIRDINSN
ncbi:MAG: polysaccharide biosynthesis C-terminal domain-containing protein [Ignavibacteriaceae bacterium]|nr:polysaccharide biosynthesis C-terminal domain-containing protein [Ignavibacteriaceae bacterium]